MNEAFARLVRADIKKLLDCEITPLNLYLQDSDRDQWVHDIRQHPQEISVFFTEFLPQIPEGEPGHPGRLCVADIATIVADEDGSEMVLGLVVDVTEQQVQREVDANRIKAYRSILDLPWVNVALHEINDAGYVIHVNECERALLSVPPAWDHGGHHICEWSPAAKDWETKRLRVARKLAGRLLTVREHRTFRKLRGVEAPPQDGTVGQSSDAGTETVPVNIHDFAVPDPIHVGKNREIFTAVRDERIPPDLASLFRRFGPKNPLLEEAGICTFVKVLPQFAGLDNAEVVKSIKSVASPELVFTFGNAPFVCELQELSVLRRTATRIESAEMLLGRTESELFPEHAAAFAAADGFVISHQRDDQRIEKHPSPNGAAVDVQVLKMPLFLLVDEDGEPQSLSIDPGPGRPAVGVEGFYWTVSGESAGDVLSRLRELYKPSEILDDIPVPVYRKDGTTTLFAAIDLADGKLIADRLPRHRHQEWLKFLKKIDAQTPA
ncbi:MAG: hypothetical protein H0T47_24245, partial [Planctomycetaceae bacterium]|nr:hypothetical protein [Planctomycetaceae bacterium]